MSTFSINSKAEAQLFSTMLSQYWKSSGAGSRDDDTFLSDLYDICEHLNPGRKIFTSVMDLELTYLFMMKDVMQAGGVWNQKFSKGKLEGGSILDDYGKFRGKVDILEGFTSFTYRCRAFWDKYMGLLVLMYAPDDYEKYCSAKSRKNKFRTICSKWENFSPEIQESLITALQMHSDPLYNEFKDKDIFPDPFIDIFYTFVEQLDNHYRTAEAHGTGSIRKWSLSMLPMEQSKDFGLVGHCNLATSMIQGLRRALLQKEFCSCEIE